MAMFDKGVPGVDGATSPGTVVGANVKLTGTLKDVNDITVHGAVEGEVISDRVVTIAETAKVKGPITATAVTIAGTVNGAVTATERCELLPSARVTGSISTSDLAIKSGALFNGKATMTEPQQSEKNDLMKLAASESASESAAAEEAASESVEPATSESEPTDETAASAPTEPRAELED